MSGHSSPDAKAGATALEHLRRELARGTAELVVLSVLNAGKRYGYALLKVLQQTGDGVLEVKEGTLYPLLHRLEDAGYITGEWQAEGRARPRKYYVITPKGRTHLELLRTEWTALIKGMQALLHSLDKVEP